MQRFIGPYLLHREVKKFFYVLNWTQTFFKLLKNSFTKVAEIKLDNSCEIIL